MDFIHCFSNFRTFYSEVSKFTKPATRSLIIVLQEGIIISKYQM